MSFTSYRSTIGRYIALFSYRGRSSVNSFINGLIFRSPFLLFFCEIHAYCKSREHRETRDFLHKYCCKSPANIRA